MKDVKKFEELNKEAKRKYKWLNKLIKDIFDHNITISTEYEMLKGSLDDKVGKIMDEIMDIIDRHAEDSKLTYYQIYSILGNLIGIYLYCHAMYNLQSLSEINWMNFDISIASVIAAIARTISGTYAQFFTFRDLVETNPEEINRLFREWIRRRLEGEEK